MSSRFGSEVLSAASFDSFALDLLSSFQDGLAAPEVDIGGCEVVERFMVAPVIVVLDEVSDGAFEIAGQVVVFE